MSATGAASGQLIVPKKKLDSMQAKAWAPGATFSHTTPNGKVYIMPFDHMRCLVPDMRKTAPMPVVKPRTPEIMPNGFSQTPKTIPHTRKKRDE